MDKRSWPWKKKSSDKSGADKSIPISDSTSASRDDQEINRKPKYVQISVESYSHLTGLEDQVKAYEDQVKNLEEEVNELNEKLSTADEEINNKEDAVKQHNKVAEEAVSGWEKAEEEAAALKTQLESVALLKLTAEDRAAHLDGALKECMRQIRNLKEEHEQNLHEVALTQTKQFDRLKAEFEAKMANMDRELMRSAAENAALSRSLQERSNMLIKISEEKSQAEADIELLKINIDSCEREINSLKYETHILTKELEIRNEEKNMSVRSAEAANKQHLEGVKKIAKLESECQRLRGLVRKKLPGPAAVAQMKLEVENMGRDYGETRVRRSPGKPPSPHSPQFSEYSLDNILKFHRENDFLTERLVEMEEETKMLKEALAMRNSELQASRNMCAKTINMLQSLEAQAQANDQLASPLKASNIIPNEGFLSHGAISLPGFTSVSEYGNDDQESCAGSSNTASVSEKPNRSESAIHLELMDDFLEMEELAYNSNGAVSGAIVETTEGLTDDPDSHPKEQTGADVSPNDVSATVEFAVEDQQSGAGSSPLRELQSKISMLLHSMPEDADVDKILDDIKHSVKKTLDNKVLPEEAEVTPEKEINFSEDCEPDDGSSGSISDDLALAISQVHDFVLIMEKETKSAQGLSPDEDGLSHKIQNFSLTLDSVIQGKTSLMDFVIDLSHVLNKAGELRFNIQGSDKNESETNSSDCIDKVALPDIPQEGKHILSAESNEKCEEFEQLKQDKDELVLELARSSETLESTKAQLQETKQLLAEAKSQLASAQKTNGLAETQLKCMAESYKSLETRADELQTEVNILQTKIENLDNELKEEKNNHHDALNKCKDLEDQLQSIAAADNTNQENNLAAASEKLAECQETIFLLGKQLNSLRPQTDTTGWPFLNRIQKGEHSPEEEPTMNGMNVQDYDQIENLQRLGGESPMNLYNPQFSPSEAEGYSPLRSPINSNFPKHRPTRSGSSSSSSNPTPEKNPRGFSRFFSTKTKNGY